MDEPLIPGLPSGFSQGLYQPVMGTDLRVQVWAADHASAQHAEQLVVDEIQRLATIFTTWDDGSALMRWRRGELEADTEPELDRVLATAADWFHASGGAFHPACEPLRTRWLRAATEGVVPSRDEMRALAAVTGQLGWQVVDGQVHRVGDCSGADLNAFVKGWIVDAAGDRALHEVPGVTRLGINAGGDLRHWGSGAWRVGVEDPLRPADNGADRLCTVTLANAAIATSGLARRGFRVGDEWFGHVIDPRTGWPVDHVAQITVVAPTAATADVLATIGGVLPLPEGIAFLEAEPGAEALVVAADGSQHTTSGWGQHLATAREGEATA